MRIRIFTQQREHTTTRIVRRDDEPTTKDVQLTVPALATVTSRNWEAREEEFNGFDSPPGRF
jgi:hypothetical protein